MTSDAQSGEVLMLGYMNTEALEKTIATGEAHYWSRSREVLWHKGATSGLVQRVVEMCIDDDQAAGQCGRLSHQLPRWLSFMLLQASTGGGRQG